MQKSVILKKHDLDLLLFMDKVREEIEHEFYLHRKLSRSFRIQARFLAELEDVLGLVRHIERILPPEGKNTLQANSILCDIRKALDAYQHRNTIHTGTK